VAEAASLVRRAPHRLLAAEVAAAVR
jgi:hypothetical protein